MMFSIGKYDVEFRRARCPFFTYRRFVTETGIHLVWWRFSLTIDDATIEAYRVCGECDSDELQSRSAGDEYWTVCGSCRTVEGVVHYISKREYEERYL